MKKYIYLIPILIFAISCTGIYENGKEMAKDASFSVTQITVDDLKSKLGNDEAIHLIDVRRNTEFEHGYINEDFDYNMYLEPVNIPRGILEFKISDPEFWEDYYEDLPDKDSTEIIIYCDNGDRGILATLTLLKLGYRNVKNLEGGYNAWNPDQNKETEKKEESGCGG